MVNKKYKDRLFCLLFGNEEYKDNVLSLYNALCHTSHTNTEDIQIYTIDDVIYIKMKNDVSILLDSFCTFGNSKVHLIRICPSEDSCILEKCMTGILPRTVSTFTERCSLNCRLQDIQYYIME